MVITYLLRNVLKQLLINHLQASRHKHETHRDFQPQARVRPDTSVFVLCFIVTLQTGTLALLCCLWGHRPSQGLALLHLWSVYPQERTSLYVCRILCRTSQPQVSHNSPLADWLTDSTLSSDISSCSWPGHGWAWSTAPISTRSMCTPRWAWPHPTLCSSSSSPCWSWWVAWTYPGTRLPSSSGPYMWQLSCWPQCFSYITSGRIGDYHQYKIFFLC